MELNSVYNNIGIWVSILFMGIGILGLLMRKNKEKNQVNFAGLIIVKGRFLAVLSFGIILFYFVLKQHYEFETSKQNQHADNSGSIAIVSKADTQVIRANIKNDTTISDNTSIQKHDSSLIGEDINHPKQPEPNEDSIKGEHQRVTTNKNTKLPGPGKYSLPPQLSEKRNSGNGVYRLHPQAQEHKIQNPYGQGKGRITFWTDCEDCHWTISVNGTDIGVVKHYPVDPGCDNRFVVNINLDAGFYDCIAYEAAYEPNTRKTYRSVEVVEGECKIIKVAWSRRNKRY